MQAVEELQEEMWGVWNCFYRFKTDNLSVWDIIPRWLANSDWYSTDCLNMERTSEAYSSDCLYMDTKAEA